MLATIINSCAVILGALLGLLFRGRVSNKLQDSVLSGAGIITLIIGIIMALRIERILHLALSLIAGGLVGSALRIEDRVLSLGDRIHRMLPAPKDPLHPGHGEFSRGFMEASVLFCAGSMTILGSIQAASGDFAILLTKSVLDGFMAMILASGLGIGVAFSALTVLVYQGALTLLAGVFQGQLNPLVLSGISGCGGALVIMIGLGLLRIKKIPSADYLPALVFIVVFAVLDPWLPGLLKT